MIPGRYVGIADTGGISDNEYESKMNYITSELSKALNESENINDELRKVFGDIGYDL